jgi:hypothetical protein
MSKFKLLLAALIGAAILSAPAMARRNHPNLRHPTANAYARATTGATNACGQACSRDRMHSVAESDPWGHWGSYYGPMVHFR